MAKKIPAALKARSLPVEPKGDRAARVKAGQRPVKGPRGAKPDQRTKTALDRPGGGYNADRTIPD